MPKIQSRRQRQQKAEPFRTMEVEKTDDPVDLAETEVVEGEATESNHSVYKRQQAEWRKMKHQVAQLKKQRKALNKKQRERKKEISKEIKLLIASMRAKHEQELRDLGIVKPVSTNEEDDDDLMEDDDN
jgi:hypothetical protein